MVYATTTYPGHPWYSVDIPTYNSQPIYAPEDGSVAQTSWDTGNHTIGNEILWTSADGRETLLVAHLSAVVKTGPVAGGDHIANAGHTGNCDPPDFEHLHVERKFDGSYTELIMSGRTVVPGAIGAPNYYTSNGPISAVPPTVDWWGPWGGAPVIACEPNETKLRVNGNGSALTWVGGQANYGGVWNDLGQFTWTGVDPYFAREWWFPLNTSQKVTLRGIATNGVGQGTSDYVRYVTNENWSVTGDFDGDGKADLARLVDDGSTTMSIWLGRSDAEKFSFAKAWTSTGWSRLNCQAVPGDVDGDGKAEIVVLYRYGDNATGVWAFDWNGTGFTGRRPYYAASGKEWYRMKPLCADIDGDGRDELVTAFDYDGWSGYDTGMLAWDLEGAVAPEPIAPWTETHNGWWDWSSSYFLGGDFNGDGRDEVAACYNYGDNAMGLWLFDGFRDGKFTAIDKRHTVTGWGFGRDKATVGDLDGDGRDEIAHLYDYAGWGGFAIGLFTVDIDGATVSYSRKWTAPTGSWDWTRTRPMASDVDADGKDEVFALYDYGTRTSREAWGTWFWRPDRANWAGVKTWNKPTGLWSTTPGVTLGSFAGPLDEHARLAGADRYATAVEVSKRAFPAGASAVIIATGANFPDALAATPLAKAYGAPILLVPPTGLSSVVAGELQRLNPKSVIIVGAESAVSRALATQIGAIASHPVVTRIGGATRYETAAAVADALKAKTGIVNKVVVVTGSGYADALAVAPLAAVNGWPILLTHTSSLPPATTGAIARLGVTSALVVGSTGAVSDAVKNALPAAERVGGATRYETAALLADYAKGHGMSYRYLAVAFGGNYPDALAAGPLVAAQGGMLMLTPTTGLPESVRSRIAINRVNVVDIDVLGGVSVMPATIVAELRRALW